MISMVEKICRLGISDCERQLKNMTQELREHREEFLESSKILEFEKEWMEAYIEATDCESNCFYNGI